MAIPMLIWDALLEGIKDSLGGVQPTLSPEEQTAIIEMVRTRQAEMEAAAQAERDSMAADSKAAGVAYLAEECGKC